MAETDFHSKGYKEIKSCHLKLFRPHAGFAEFGQVADASGDPTLALLLSGYSELIMHPPEQTQLLGAHI